MLFGLGVGTGYGIEECKGLRRWMRESWGVRGGVLDFSF